MKSLFVQLHSIQIIIWEEWGQDKFIASVVCADKTVDPLNYLIGVSEGFTTVKMFLLAVLVKWGYWCMQATGAGVLLKL